MSHIELENLDPRDAVSKYFNLRPALSEAEWALLQDSRAADNLQPGDLPDLLPWIEKLREFRALTLDSDPANGSSSKPQPETIQVHGLKYLDNWQVLVNMMKGKHLAYDPERAAHPSTPIESWHCLHIRWDPSDNVVDPGSGASMPVGLKKMVIQISPHVDPKDLSNAYRQLQRKIGILRQPRRISPSMLKLASRWVLDEMKGTPRELDILRAQIAAAEEDEGMGYIKHPAMLRRRMKRLIEQVLSPSWSRQAMSIGTSTVTLSATVHVQDRKTSGDVQKRPS